MNKKIFWLKNPKINIRDDYLGWIEKKIPSDTTQIEYIKYQYKTLKKVIGDFKASIYKDDNNYILLIDIPTDSQNTILISGMLIDFNKRFYDDKWNWKKFKFIPTDKCFTLSVYENDFCLYKDYINKSTEI